jgi:hypothetical protein
MCAADDYLLGCQPLSKGECKSCPVTYGRGCTNCTTIQAGGCLTRNCTAVFEQMCDTVMEYLGGCSAESQGSCLSTSTTTTTTGSNTTTTVVDPQIAVLANVSAGCDRGGFGAGCTACDVDASGVCTARDCGYTHHGSGARCGSEEYLSGCTAQAEGECVSCATAYGIGCTDCRSDTDAGECVRRDCSAVEVGMCKSGEYLVGCTA